MLSRRALSIHTIQSETDWHMFSNTDLADLQVLNHTDANELAEFAKVNVAWCSAAGRKVCFPQFDLLLIVSILACNKQAFLVWQCRRSTCCASSALTAILSSGTEIRLLQSAGTSVHRNFTAILHQCSALLQNCDGLQVWCMPTRGEHHDGIGVHGGLCCFFMTMLLQSVMSCNSQINCLLGTSDVIENESYFADAYWACLQNSNTVMTLQNIARSCLRHPGTLHS